MVGEINFLGAVADANAERAKGVNPLGSFLEGYTAGLPLKQKEYNPLAQAILAQKFAANVPERSMVAKEAGVATGQKNAGTNALRADIQQQVADTGQQNADIKAESAKILNAENATKLQMHLASSAAASPDATILQDTLSSVDVMANALGKAPNDPGLLQAKAAIQGEYDKGGPAGLRAFNTSKALDARDRVSKFSQVNLGDKVVTIATNPVTSQPTITSEMATGVSPQAQLANNTKISEGALNRKASADNAKAARQARIDELPQFTPEALQLMADKFRVTGELPAVGNRAGNAKVAAVNKAAKDAVAAGQSGGDLVANQAQYKADKGSLAKQQASADTLTSFDKNLKGALGLLGPLAAKMQNGQIPGINHMSQLVSYQGGDENIKAFKNQLLISMMDYMKMATAGSNITATELSQGAQKKADELLTTYDNPGTIANQMALMLKDAEIKAGSVKSTVAEVQGRLKGGNTAPLTIGRFKVEVH